MQRRRLDSPRPRNSTFLAARPAKRRAAGEVPATTRWPALQCSFAALTRCTLGAERPAKSRPQHALRFNAAPPPCSSRPRSSVVGEVPATTRSVLECSVAALTRRTATPKCAASQHHQRRRTLHGSTDGLQRHAPSSLKRRRVSASQHLASVYGCYVLAPKPLCSVAGAASRRL